MSELPLFDQPPAAPPDPDADARVFAVDPRNNVVLEASAGTGKTTVLVQRYVNLLKAGVEPSNILAITFTHKAATEMRDRIVAELKKAATLSEFDKSRWLAIRDRLGEISISTIDAFCLSLLREFPLEADLDPGFDMADETEVPRFIEEALDRSMRIFTAIAKDDPDVALVIAQLGAARTRAGLASLLDRRLVAWSALDRFLTRGPAHLHAADVCQRAATALLAEPLLRLPPPASWDVLTHAGAEEGWNQAEWTGARVHATYATPADAAAASGPPPDTSHVFWSSIAQFERLRGGLAPDVHHASRPGKTAEHLRRAGLRHVQVFPSAEAWQQWIAGAH